MLLNRHRAKKPDIEEIQAFEPAEEVPVIDYEAMAKAEIIEALKKTEIEFDGRQKKEELITSQFARNCRNKVIVFNEYFEGVEILE